MCNKFCGALVSLTKCNGLRFLLYLTEKGQLGPTKFTSQPTNGHRLPAWKALCAVPGPVEPGHTPCHP